MKDTPWSMVQKNLEPPSHHDRSDLSEECKDESVLLVAGRWKCGFYNTGVKFQHHHRFSEKSTV